MRDVESLVKAHLNAWALTDPQQRAAEIERVYTENVTIVEREGMVHGREALNEHIGQLQQQFSGLELSVNGAIHRHHDHAMYEWQLPTALQPQNVTGWDVLHFEGDLIDQAIIFIAGFDDLDAGGEGETA